MSVICSMSDCGRPLAPPSVLEAVSTMGFPARLCAMHVASSIRAILSIAPVEINSLTSYLEGGLSEHAPDAVEA